MCRYRSNIEKCSSPTGDGNLNKVLILPVEVNRLRNVVPRQGTETAFDVLENKKIVTIEKCSSPTGDGNL